MARLPCLLLATVTAIAAAAPARAADPYGPKQLDSGLVLPYPLINVFRGFGKCYRGTQKHQAIDVGGVGEDWGIGTPVRSMAKARIVSIGTPESDPHKYGRRDRRRGFVERGGKRLPRSRVIAPYGRVYFFTRNHGRYRTGVLLTTVALAGPLKGHRIRYMHLAAVHPSLKPGSVVEAGQEIGIMGGTAVMDSAPHVHIDVETPSGERVDVAPLFGLAPTRKDCDDGHLLASRHPAALPRGAEPKPLRRDPPKRGKGKVAEAPDEEWQRRKPVDDCGTWTHEEDFRSQKFVAHRYVLDPPKRAADKPWTIELTRTRGRMKPRVIVYSASGDKLYDGRRATRKGRRRFRFKRRHSGWRGRKASLEIRPRKGWKPLIVRVSDWSTKAGEPPSRRARYRLEIDRPCSRHARAKGGWRALHRGITHHRARIPRAGLVNRTLKKAVGRRKEPLGKRVRHQGKRFVAGKASWFGGPGEKGAIAREKTALTGEVLGELNRPLKPKARDLERRPKDFYFAALRLDYRPRGPKWWRKARLLVLAPDTGRAVVVRVVDWGPHPKTGRLIDLSPQALKDLGVKTDARVLVAFAPAGAPLGPVDG